MVKDWRTWHPKRDFVIPDVGEISRGDEYLFRMNNLAGKPLESYFFLSFERGPVAEELFFSSVHPKGLQANAEHIQVNLDDFKQGAEIGEIRPREWLEETEPLYHDIQSAIFDEIYEAANIRAAEAYSTPSDDLIDRYVDPWIEADFGGFLAVNGEHLPPNSPAECPPEGYLLSDEGGAIPSTEMEVQMEFVIEGVAVDMKLPVERIEGVADDLFYKNFAVQDVSGSADVYVPEGVF